MADAILRGCHGPAALQCRNKIGARAGSLDSGGQILFKINPVCGPRARQVRRVCASTRLLLSQEQALKNIGGHIKWSLPTTRRGRRRRHLFARVVGPSTGVAAAAEAEAVVGGDEGEYSEDEGEDLSDITEWQLDFCSRPIVDERGKKVWELLICDSARRFEYAQYFPNNVINSGSLRQALQDILDKFEIPKPRTIKYFR
jgi:hypothetical protein